MPDTRSRSKSPRRSSSSSHSKDKDRNSSGSRESSTTKAEEKSKTSSSSRSKDSSNAHEKTDRKPKSAPRPSNYTNSSSVSNSGGKKERKFTGRCRLFVGNLVNCDEQELAGMFKKFGEVAETFVNKEKGFGFIRMVCNVSYVDTTR